jgi:membrane-associated phospholipid phosphatase
MLFPIAMFTSTLVTGNHYIVDGLLGGLVSGTALYIAYRIQQWDDARKLRAAEDFSEAETEVLAAQAPTSS